MSGFKSVDFTEYEIELILDALWYRARGYQTTFDKNRRDWEVQRVMGDKIRELRFIRDKFKLVQNK